MVMQEMDKPRDTFILMRGQYDKPGEKITAGLPGSCPLPGAYPPNRLGLAQWLTDPDHPLTSARRRQSLLADGVRHRAGEDRRRLRHAGRASVPSRTAGLARDGVYPHRLEREGHDAPDRHVGHVSSSRRASRPRLREKDPENRLLARGPRFRLPAEFIRDQALAVSGLLVPKIGGPSVKPYQPAGLWEEIAFGGGFSAQTYVSRIMARTCIGAACTRSGNAPCPPPSLQAFDAPEREFCMVRRSITNTPLQALALMNDPTYVEASRKLAERMLTEAGRIAGRAHSVRVPPVRVPSGHARRAESAKACSTINWPVSAKTRKRRRNCLRVGESKRDEKLDPAELAAWTIIASTLLNLDETITKN